MTTYTGELLRITATAADFENVAITPAEVAGMFVSIFSARGEPIVTEVPMAYSIEEELWYYLWDTSGGATPTALVAGTYKVKLLMLDLDDHSSWEWTRVRLAKDPT